MAKFQYLSSAIIKEFWMPQWYHWKWYRHVNASYKELLLSIWDSIKTYMATKLCTFATEIIYYIHKVYCQSCSYILKSTSVYSCPININCKEVPQVTVTYKTPFSVFHVRINVRIILHSSSCGYIQMIH